MIETLKYLPTDKQEELVLLTKLLKHAKGVEMVILFGSYARGEQVEDIYTEKGTTYEYKSDFDILVVTTHDNLGNNHKIEDKVAQELSGQVITSINLIFHSIKHLNQALSMGNYFFQDIKKEGIILHDSGKFRLQNPKKLTPAEAKQKAQDYFNQWFISANHFLEDYESNLEKERFHKAAFELHQAVERYYTTILLVFTDYRPKAHDLMKLDLRVRNCDARFNVFPRATDREKELFELLKRAYIDSRYKMDEFQITKEQLEYLAEKVQQLKSLTEEICSAKIEKIGK